MIRLNIPKRRIKGLFIHQPSSTKKGIQKIVNCTLRSMARAFASVGGCSGVARMKYRNATTPSALNDTIGSRIKPNHSAWMFPS